MDEGQSLRELLACLLQLSFSLCRTIKLFICLGNYKYLRLVFYRAVFLGNRCLTKLLSSLPKSEATLVSNYQDEVIEVESIIFCQSSGQGLFTPLPI